MSDHGLNDLTDRIAGIREDVTLLGVKYHEALSHEIDADRLGDVVKEYQTEVRKKLRECQKAVAATARAIGDHAAALEDRFARHEARCDAEVADVAAVAITDGFDPAGCFVYVLWGSDDETPLYVGQSTNVLSRLGQHVGGPIYRNRVRKVTLIRCRDGKAMDLTEMRLIRHYRPHDNVVGNHRKDPAPVRLSHPRKKARVVARLARLAYQVPEAAEILGITEDDVYQRVMDGTLRGNQLGRLWIIPASELDGHMAVTDPRRWVAS